MPIILLSVPHTGTRYTGKFLKSLGVTYVQYHAEPVTFEDVKEDMKWEKGKVITPMRDPALQWLSCHLRNGLKKPAETLEYCESSWDLLARLSKNFDVEYLRLDAEDPQKELEKVAIHCGTTLSKQYNTSPVGNFLEEPIGYELWEKHKTPEVEATLEPYRIKHGYLSNNKC